MAQTLVRHEVTPLSRPKSHTALGSASPQGFLHVGASTCATRAVGAAPDRSGTSDMLVQVTASPRTHAADDTPVPNAGGLHPNPLHRLLLFFGPSTFIPTKSLSANRVGRGRHHVGLPYTTVCAARTRFSLCSTGVYPFSELR